MPDRYHIKPVPTPGRFHRTGKFGSVDAREDCSRCTNCVKPRCCYDVYARQAAYDRDPASPWQPLSECKACLSCVQSCTKGLLTVALNPEYLDMGNEYWKPDIIATTWNQAETGKIPVSGAGYRGRFHGPGFDSIWTDMSEIVRPTRDGIHGREYISTTADIGAKPMRLTMAPDGSVVTPPANLIEVQMPALLDQPPWPIIGQEFGLARIAAAATLKTLCVIRPECGALAPATQVHAVVPMLAAADEVAKFADLIKKVRMVEVIDGPAATAVAEAVRKVNPAVILAVRLDLTPKTGERLKELVAAGLRVFHLCADLNGREKNAPKPKHLKDALRAIHGQLVDAGVRDETTLIASGGIALAEHMAKTIICGADLVAVGTPLLVALGCRVCRGAHADGKAAPAGQCPAHVKDNDVAYAAQRMINLMGAWHSQLIEVLGAMGIREVRRLRGEVGRAIFREEIEREAFGDLIRK